MISPGFRNRTITLLVCGGGDDSRELNVRVSRGASSVRAKMVVQL